MWDELVEGRGPIRPLCVPKEVAVDRYWKTVAYYILFVSLELDMRLDICDLKDNDNEK